MEKCDTRCNDLDSVPPICQSTPIECTKAYISVFNNAHPCHQNTSIKMLFYNNVTRSTLGLSLDESMSRVIAQTNHELSLKRTYAQSSSDQDRCSWHQLDICFVVQSQRDADYRVSGINITFIKTAIR
ncbi:hypothetical protein TNCV_1928621 [Trichonephila clavipes]|nr:hypothetical protein TNCV_1928621 [Trichonephila clavipes]